MHVSLARRVAERQPRHQMRPSRRSSASRPRQGGQRGAVVPHRQRGGERVERVVAPHRVGAHRGVASAGASRSRYAARADASDFTTALA
jgi:hypothetical protein